MTSYTDHQLHGINYDDDDAGRGTEGRGGDKLNKVSPANGNVIYFDNGNVNRFAIFSVHQKVKLFNSARGGSLL